MHGPTAHTRWTELLLLAMTEPRRTPRRATAADDVSHSHK